MGKKSKSTTETAVDRERVIEADYYARKCGITREEALKILKDARTFKPFTSHPGRAKAR